MSALEFFQFLFNLTLYYIYQIYLHISQDINEFLLLGQSVDRAPGETLDKVARRLGVHEMPEYRDIPG